MVNRSAALAAMASAQSLGGSRLSRLAKQPVPIAVDRLLRWTGCTKEVSLPTFWGGQFDGVLPEAITTAVRRFGLTDPGVCRSLLDKLPEGGTFVDVGAHFGFFTLMGSALAGPSGRVIAVEAMPETQHRLGINVQRNAAYDNVTIVPAAAHNCEATLTFNDFGTVNSSLNSSHASRGASGPTARSVSVVARRLDDMLSELGVEEVSIMKIDAESSEIQVLEGAEETLTKYSPPLVVEAATMTPAQRTHSETVDAWLKVRGYRGHRWQDGALVALTSLSEVRYENVLYLCDR